jgi:hypothetical protein
MLALPDGAYETQGAGPEAPRTGVNAAFPIKLDRAPLMAACSLQFRNQNNMITGFPVLCLFCALDIIDVADAR